MVQPNPFRTRHSEATARNLSLYMTTFAPEALLVLPPPPFDQFYVFRSAPGAGKTSLMKALEADTLEYVHQNRSRAPSLVTFLTDFGVLGLEGAKVLGVIENLDQNYAGLIDVAADPELQRRLLFRLLDVRVMQSVVRAATLLAGAGARTARAVTFHPTTPDAKRAFSRLGGFNGHDLLQACEAAEDELLDLFDEIVTSTNEMPSGHGRLHSLIALSATEIRVEGVPIDARPLIMFDDAHALSQTQRSALMGELRNRSLSLGRWLAVRNVALDDDDLFGAGDEGRDYEVIEIEALAREHSNNSVARRPLTGQKLTHHRFRKMLLDIADKRATPALDRIVTDELPLTRMLDVDPNLALEGPIDAFDYVRSQIQDMGGTDPRYSEWMRGTERLQGREGLMRLCELEVLIRRDRARTQDELFQDLPLSAQEVSTRGSSALRDAAYFRTATELGLPYYFGSDMLSRLGSANIEQFLELCGDMMARLLTQDATGRELSLTPAIQDKIVREASRRYYRSLVQLPNGELIQNFIDGIAAISRDEGAKPTIPYPPGVSGTALSMSDRSRLRDATQRKIPQLEMLYSALGSAIAHNVVWIELDYRVKNGNYMVVYLNRLLCPYLSIPLGLGGFRERKLLDMASWMPGQSSQSSGAQGRLL